MSNIIIAENDDPMNWSPEKKKAIYRYLQNEEMQEFREIMSRSVERMESKVLEITQEMSTMKSDITNFGTKEYILQNIYKNDYNSLERIGKQFNPSLNKLQMPELLRKLKIIQQNFIEPVSDYQKMNPPLAIKSPSTDSTGATRWNYHFNSDRLWKLVCGKLERLGLLEKFLSLSTPKEIWNFINSL